MGKAKKGYIIDCTFNFECPKKWETLATTAVAYVLHCHQWSKDVTLVLNSHHLDYLSANGACVAIFRSIPQRQLRMPIGLSATKGEKMRSYTGTL